MSVKSDIPNPLIALRADRVGAPLQGEKARMSLITIKRSAEVLPRPKRPIYWSALGVVLGGTIISCVAMGVLESVHAASVVNSVLLIFVAMARGFFGGGDNEDDSPKDQSKEN